MEPKETISQSPPVEAVVAVFNTSADASRVAASLRGPNLQVQKVSRGSGPEPDQMADLIYDPIDHVSTGDTSSGILQGGAIGAGSGLLLLGIPGLNIAAPIAGALAGMFIGGIAGIDEANRSIELPQEVDYEKMLVDGKSFVVIAGDETTRAELETKMKELGAVEVYQHPPVGQALRHQS